MKYEVKGEDLQRTLYITLDDGTILEVRAGARCAEWSDMEYEVFIDDELVFFD